ncbi:MAG: MxaS protein, partial [Betaproteobacteria bacterium]
MAGGAGEFLYRIPGRPAGTRPGAHPSRMDGGAGAFLGLQPLLTRPNPRRLDLRRSLTDPFGQWLVRNMSERVSIPLFVVADVSASMLAGAAGDKRDALADLVASAGLSAWRAGDPFGFVAADGTVREELFRPAAHTRGIGSLLAERVRACAFDGAGAGGLL